MKKAEIPVLEVRELRVAFRMYRRGLSQSELVPIQALNLSVYRGEILAVVGASGSGKSLLAHAIMGILPGNASVGGCIRYHGEVLTPARQRALRGTELALIPQSVENLDPLMRVGKQVIGTKSSAEAQRAAFRRYDLGEAVEKMYPPPALGRHGAAGAHRHGHSHLPKANHCGRAHPRPE